MVRRAIAAVVIGLVLGALPQPASAGYCATYTDAEREMLANVNRARGAEGLSTLTLDPELTRVARRHTRQMLERGALYHTPTAKLESYVTRWMTLGENVGRGKSIDSVHAKFMSSSGHRFVEMNGSFRYVGIGTAHGDGRVWVTVVFESRNDPGTTLSMPSCRSA